MGRDLNSKGHVKKYSLCNTLERKTWNSFMEKCNLLRFCFILNHHSIFSVEKKQREVRFDVRGQFLG